MPNKETNIFGDNPKLAFFLGLFAGVAVLSTVCAIVLVVALFSGNGFSFAKSAGEGDVAAQPAAAQPADAEEAETYEDVPAVSANDHVWGSDDAKVTLITYSDFECPYCYNFSQTIDQIKDEYSDDVRIVFRHFPLSFHPNAKDAAYASECAAEQGEFWEMHDLIFEANANDEMSLETWKEYAADLGLDTNDFNDCLNNQTYASKISSQMQAGQAAGVKGTPATFVNGKLVSGALPFETFKQIIDSELE